MSSPKDDEQQKPARKFKPPRISTRQLERILRHYGAQELKKRGKGSHSFYERTVNGVRGGTPVPKDSDLSGGTIDSIRRKLKLMPEDGVTDEEFYSHR